jgi:hypothetical protein
MPSLTLYDLTVGYMGVPASGYAQDYYTLQSIFGLGHCSPQVHIHFRSLSLDQLPLGHLRPNASPEQLDEEVTGEEREIFEEWLRGTWMEKDERMRGFYRKGEFDEGQRRREVEIRLRRTDLVTLASIPLALIGVWKVVAFVAL